MKAEDIQSLGSTCRVLAGNEGMEKQIETVYDNGESNGKGD